MNILNALFPIACPLCGEILQKESERVCAGCKEKISYVTEPCCIRCGKPLEGDRQEYCLDCGRKRASGIPDPVCQGTALWVYTDQMKRAMADFKYKGCYSDAAFYAEELVRFRGSKIRSWHPDFMIPVPLHRRKRWFRGYNQVSCVAEKLGIQMGIPVLPAILERKRYTRPQAGFDDAGRRNNVKDAFRLSQTGKSLRGKRILLLDDIYTTGATIESCARTLIEAGVEKVYFACLCIGRDY